MHHIKKQENKNFKDPVTVKSNGMHVSIAANKDIGKQVNKRDATEFYNMADGIKKGKQGTAWYDAVYACSVGFKGESSVEIKRPSAARNNDDPENKLDFQMHVLKMTFIPQSSVKRFDF